MTILQHTNACTTSLSTLLQGHASSLNMHSFNTTPQFEALRETLEVRRGPGACDKNPLLPVPVADKLLSHKRQTMFWREDSADSNRFCVAIMCTLECQDVYMMIS